MRPLRIVGALVVACVLTSATAGAAGERVDVTTMDGVQLIGELDGTTGPGVVLVPDAGGERRADAAIAAALAARGFRVLRLDLRGHGDSSGTPDLTAAASDVEGAFRYLIARKIRPVFLIGQGATVPAVLSVAAKVPTSGVVMVEASPKGEATNAAVPVLRLEHLNESDARTRVGDWLSDPKGANTTSSHEAR